MTWRRHLHVVPLVNPDSWHGWESFWAYVLDCMDGMQDHLGDPVAYCEDGILTLSGRTMIAIRRIAIDGQTDYDEFGKLVPEGA